MKHLLLTTIAAVVLVGTALADPIHDAVVEGDIEVVKGHLNSGVDVNVKNEKGWTPLHYPGKTLGLYQAVSVVCAYISLPILSVDPDL